MPRDIIIIIYVPTRARAAHHARSRGQPRVFSPSRPVSSPRCMSRRAFPLLGLSLFLIRGTRYVSTAMSKVQVYMDIEAGEKAVGRVTMEV